MLLSSKDGIKCDICGNEFRKKFSYYSYDCHKVDVDVEKAETKKATDVEGSIVSFDVCEECHRVNVQRILENQK